jgi:hypothetical protein
MLYDPKTSNPIHTIEDRALPPSVPVVAPLTLAASMALAAFMVSGGSLVLMAAVTTPVATYGYLKVKNWMQAKAYERQHDSVAWLIDSDRDMVQYLKLKGNKAVVSELLTAYEHGMELSKAARMALDRLAPTLPTNTLAGYLAAPGDPQGTDQTVAIDTKAVEVPGTDRVVRDVVDAFVSDLRCSVLCAPPRTGKGIVAAGMMAGFKLSYPAGVLFSSTIKQYSPEDWYFAQSDYHINPSVDEPIALARSLYSLYTAWETSNSTAEAPSLLVIDELRDTLLALKGVLCADVSPDIKSMETRYDEYLRAKLISAATLNQCHKRYLLLIAPTSTAQGMTFKDANSLRSYASYTLVTPTELAFSEGSNGTFAAPAIRPDSPVFAGWYGLAWASKSKEWLGVPCVPGEAIALKEAQPVSLNYLEQPQAAMVNPVHINACTVPGVATASVATVAVAATEAEVITQEAYATLATSGPMRLTQLIPNGAVRKRLGAEVTEALGAMEGITVVTTLQGSVRSTTFHHGGGGGGGDDGFPVE